MKQLIFIISSFLVTNFTFAQEEEPKYHGLVIGEALVEGDTKFEHLLDGLKKEAQSFSIDSNADTVLELTSGTKITIPSGAFTNSSGTTINGEVAVSFNEFISISDMILEGLSTVDTEGRLLESGGMFNLNATDKKGNELAIDEAKSLQIELVTDAKPKPFKLYKSKIGNRWKLQNEGRLYLIPLVFFISPNKIENGLRLVNGSKSVKYDILFGGSMVEYYYHPYKLGYPFSDNFPFSLKNEDVNFLDFVFPKLVDKNKIVKIISNKGKEITALKVRLKEYKTDGSLDSVKIDILSKNNQFNTDILEEKLTSVVNLAIPFPNLYNPSENLVIRVVTYKTPILPSIGLLNGINVYTANIISMGFKNLDQLIDEQSPRVSIKIKSDVIPVGRCYITFKNRKVVAYETFQYKNETTFEQIVKDEPCKIIAFGMKEGKVVFAEKDFVATGEETVSLEFEELNSNEDLKARIQRIFAED
ncbi:hypothetical protein R9C00_22460 [Flammeovirgaceae bacterium SG7u.111]|nr:hypothetical protein [Flammeovirgaceae bacterium SG7u.132]WPO34467.1 hypothetical protein R9C00_22460 [Flammeovirgaceae bacterium SG7u.111]